MLRYLSYSIVVVWLLMAILGFVIGEGANEVILSQFLAGPNEQAWLG